MEIKLLLSVIIFFAFSIIKSWSQLIKKTNFVLIVADDLGFADLSFNGGKQIPTPNIDKLTKAGINLTQGYISSPVSSRSRTDFINGRNQVSFDHDNNTGNNQLKVDTNFLSLPPNVTEDPSELNNLSLKHLTRTKNMLKQLGEWNIKQPHPVFLEEAIGNSYQIGLHDQEYQLRHPQ